MKKFFFFVLPLLLCTNLIAQNETGTRYLDSAAFKESGFWYDSTNSMFPKQYPIILSIPPLSTGMPYDIILSYIYLDSLLRFSTILQQDSLLRTWDIMNDTLANAVKYLFMMTDYDPIIFNQYLVETALHRINDSSGIYRSQLFYLRNNLALKLKSLVPPYEKNALFALLFADYILKVQVVSIDSTIDKRATGIMEGRKRYNVHAMVLDTIKGKTFFSEEQTGPPTQIKEDNPPSPLYPTITFQYLNIMYYQHSYNPNDPSSNIVNDSAFINSSGGFVMHPHQEAIVFLRNCNPLSDFNFDYFDLDLESLCSNNALPIIDGNVRDINMIWSPNQLQSYESWKEAALQLILKIQTGTY